MDPKIDLSANEPTVAFLLEYGYLWHSPIGIVLMPFLLEQAATPWGRRGLMEQMRDLADGFPNAPAVMAAVLTRQGLAPTDA